MNHDFSLVYDWRLQYDWINHMFIIVNCLGIDNFRFYCCGETFVAHPIAKLYLYISGLISSSFQHRWWWLVDVAAGIQGILESFQQPVTYKENFEWIHLQAEVGDADVYHRWNRSVLVLGSDCFRWFQISDSALANYVSSFYNSGRTEERPPPPIVRLLLRPVVTEMCLPNRCLAMDYSATIRCCVTVC
jgi:hypothetical protein